jgi:hypothetical protein
MQNFRIYRLPFGDASQKLILTYREGVYDNEVMLALGVTVAEQVEKVKELVEGSDGCVIFYEDNGHLLIHSNELSNIMATMDAARATQFWMEMNELSLTEETDTLYHNVLRWFAIEIDNFYKYINESRINKESKSSTDV